MSLSIWEPLRQLDEFDRVFAGMFARPERRAPSGSRPSWRPALELVEEADGYRLRLDLPGVRKEDIDVSLEKDILAIRGDRRPSTGGATQDGQRVLLRETRVGSFVRSLRLPEDADWSQVDASHADGVLEVRVLKKKAAQPRKIEIDRT